MKLKAFTLIELLIVVAIIAILAAIAVPNFLEAQTRSKVSRMKSDMRTFATALESYAVDNQKYPMDGQEPAGQTFTYLGTQFGATGHYGSARLNNMLTTPIAYITSVDGTDAFAPPTAPFVQRTLRYVNILGTYVNSATAARVAASGRYVNHVGSWQLTSMGPDRVASPTDPAYNGLFWVVLRYDPTNGTVSAGDIVRTQRSPEGDYGTPTTP